MKKLRLLAVMMVLVTLLGMIPVSSFAATSSSSSSTRYVKTSNGLSLNVRSSRKTHTDNIIAHLDYGTKVTVLREYSSWAYISWGSSSKNRGYVIKSALSKSKPSSTAASTVTKYTTNSYSNYVNLRSSMKSHTNNVIVSIRVGTKVTLIDTYSGGWSKVKYGNYTGFIQSRYLSNKKQ